MSADIDIHHLGAAYALDALDERERMAFEQHYPSCEVCRGDVLDFRATLASVGMASATSPPAALKERVMAEIGHTRQLSPLLAAKVTELAERRRRRRLAVGGLMAAAAAVVVFIAGALALSGGDGEPSYAASLAQVLQQPDARFLTLVAQPGADVGVVKVAWSQGSGTAVLLGDELATTPVGSAYELWLIGSDGPVPMRVLQRADHGELRAVVSIDGEPQAWGVTIEPAAGSPTPTGEILFVGEA
jgi:anti-sigma-K factor RskA